MRSNLATIICILLFAAACSAQGSIRDIDFENFTYEPEFCGGEDGTKITVSDGEFSKEEEIDGYVDRMYFSIFGVTYGDLDGDGRDEAVVLSVCNTGGTGNFTEAYIYRYADGKAVRMITYEGGDRAYGGLREVRIENGVLVVESNDPGEFGAACCAELIVTNRYRLKPATLEEIGKPEIRELYPAARVEFAKGAFSAKINVSIDPDVGIKRFVVGAAAGQRLTVTSTSDDVRFRFVKGEANVIEEDRELVAELQENGDFIFEVRSYTEEEVETSITVTIR